jgi:AraC-like DNA-binding protein
MTDWIADARRRKLVAYERCLDRAPSSLGAMDDVAYLHGLAEVAAHTPAGTALAFGAGRRLADLGIFGHLILSAPDLERTLEVWTRHADMAGEPAQMTSRVDRYAGEWGAAGCWTVRFIAAPVLSAGVARFVIEELVATFFAFAAEATGADFSVFETAFPFAPIRGVDYAASIPGRIRFDAREAQVSGPASLLTVSHRARDDETFAALLARLSPSWTRQGSDRRDLAARIRDCLIAVPQSPPRIDSVARALGMSARTLSRRLEAEGTSFGAVLDEYRRGLALDLLGGAGGTSVARTAHLLGYRSENSFRRAFRGWTGTSVGQWRRERQMCRKMEKGSLAK